MIKQIAWNAFKNTGDIKIMMELLEAEKAAGIETNENTINLKTNENAINFKTNESNNALKENIIKNTNEISMNNNSIDNRITNDLNSKFKT